ncbi:Protein MEI2-like 1 [Symbiodinium microadriaticum]|uniref:Protein MEI2-like 1 n=1 Tax=Symbiodinium microadriaticum TaxID=2951 RepID=A0A1Q9F5J0_SYMMI|nr:Protein MEI2-like 1 [Symbiodinium microadriaticum]
MRHLVHAAFVMQNMQGQGMLLANMQQLASNLPWQQNNMQQGQQSQPSGFQGVVQEWNQWQQVDQPSANGCVVKNTFVHMTEELHGGPSGHRRESSEPPPMRPSEGFEDSDDELGNFSTEGPGARQFSEPPQSNGQFLVIPSQNSLKSASRPQAQSAGMSVEQQLQQMNGKHQAEQQQLLAHQQMEQQKLIQQYQQQTRQQVELQEELQGDNTDDEDCIGQYQPPLTRPMAPTDGAMQWMTATLEGMCLRPGEGQVPQPSPTVGLPRAAAMADTGSTPEPCVPGKKFNKKLPKKEEDGGSGASMADQLANGDASKKRAVDPYNWEDGVVTVMVRQLPRQYTQRMLLSEVVRRGFEGLFDFLYLPYDFKKGINVGYGFINFTEPEYALQFRDSLDGQYLDKYMRIKGKAIRVHPAAVQGYEANYRHFAHTKTGQKQDPAFSPLFFPVLQGGAMQAVMKQLNEAKAAPPRMLDQNVMPCQQMPQLPMQPRLPSNGSLGSASVQTPQMVQVGPQCFPGAADDRQMPKQKGKTKKQNAQSKQPMPNPVTFKSGGVTWVGIPVGTAASQNWSQELSDQVASVAYLVPVMVMTGIVLMTTVFITTIVIIIIIIIIITIIMLIIIIVIICLIVTIAIIVNNTTIAVIMMLAPVLMLVVAVAVAVAAAVVMVDLAIWDMHISHRDVGQEGLRCFPSGRGELEALRLGLRLGLDTGSARSVKNFLRLEAAAQLALGWYWYP